MVERELSDCILWEDMFNGPICLCEWWGSRRLLLYSFQALTTVNVSILPTWSKQSLKCQYIILLTLLKKNQLMQYCLKLIIIYSLLISLLAANTLTQ